MLISEAWAQAAGGAGGSDFLVQLFPLVLIFIVFYFLLIRPQQAKMRQQREMLAGVKRGDRVVTGGGIIGLVTKVIGDNELQVELAEGVRVRIIKQTITDIVTRGESVFGVATPLPPTAAPLLTGPTNRIIATSLFVCSRRIRDDRIFLPRANAAPVSSINRL